MHNIVEFLVNTIGKFGYIGIFLLMFLESSFFPFPSEVVMIPTGYLVSKGEMTIFYSVTSGLVGSIAGAWFNYLIAFKLGRRFILKFISEKNMKKIDDFFYKHGHVSTFIGRLIPGLRQYISFPAGIAKMDGFKFTIYTAGGALIWIVILTALGYFIGDNQALINKYLKSITIFTIVMVVAIGLVYILFNIIKKKVEEKEKIVD